MLFFNETRNFDFHHNWFAKEESTLFLLLSNTPLLASDERVVVNSLYFDRNVVLIISVHHVVVRINNWFTCALQSARQQYGHIPQIRHLLFGFQRVFTVNIWIQFSVKYFNFVMRLRY